MRPELSLQVRVARPTDLDALFVLEKSSFSVDRQSSRLSLRRALNSPHQRVGVLIKCTLGEEEVIGAAILFLHPKTVRLYSIAILPEFRGEGGGNLLMRWVLAEAQFRSCHRITLEVDAQDQALITWYQRWGFIPERALPDYYGSGEGALKMVLTQDEGGASMIRTLVVMPRPQDWPYQFPSVLAISPQTYLSDPSWQRQETLRVINLCPTLREDTLGYYTSLLAAARNHRISPDVLSIKDLDKAILAARMTERIEGMIHRGLSEITTSTFELIIIFEQAENPHLNGLAKALAHQLGLPLSKVKFRKEGGRWIIRKAEVLTLRIALSRHRELIDRAAPAYFAKRRFQSVKLPTYRYDLAILVNPEESTPPSCPQAIEKFQRAAERVGFYVEQITSKDHRRLPEFDALFIRETTGVNHPTYGMARRALAEGLIVIDDPWSILRCSNKIFLFERLSRGRVRQPRAWLFYEKISWRDIYPELPFPLVIKKPEGSFSTGVYRVNDPEGLDQLLGTLFDDLELVIGQEFIESDFDWRIGVLDHQPLYACQYYMASGHWQIYNWASSDEEAKVGDSIAVPLDQVPIHVLQTALRAAACIGDGLYGVDLKERDKKVYVIEVNDNPNIDHGIEDIIEGDRIYDRIALSLLHRIERERALPRSQPSGERGRGERERDR